MAFPATNEGQELDAQNDVQIIKDALSASGSRVIASIAGTTAAVGVGVGEVNTGHYRPATGRLGVVVAGTEIGRWTASGLLVGSVGVSDLPEAPLQVRSPFAAWTTTLTQTVTGLHGDIGGMGLDEVLWDGPDYFVAGVVGTARFPDGITIANIPHGAAVFAGARSAGSINVVGVYGEATLEDVPVGWDQAGGVWGGNVVVSDGQPGAGNHWPAQLGGDTVSPGLIGLEIDVNIFDSGTIAYGCWVAGVATGNTGTANIQNITHLGNAFYLTRAYSFGGWGGNAALVKYHYGYHAQAGGAVIAFKIETQSDDPAVAAGSMPIAFDSWNLTHARRAWHFVNSEGAHIIRGGKGVSSSTTAVRFEAPNDNITANGTLLASVGDDGLTTAGPIYPGGTEAQSQIAIKTFASTGLLANNGTISLGQAQGLLFVTEKAGQKSCLVFLNGTGVTVTAASATTTGFTVNSDSGANIAIYWDGVSEYKIKNRSGSNAFIGAVLLGDLVA